MLSPEFSTRRCGDRERLIVLNEEEVGTLVRPGPGLKEIALAF